MTETENTSDNHRNPQIMDTNPDEPELTTEQQSLRNFIKSTMLDTETRINTKLLPLQELSTKVKNLATDVVKLKVSVDQLTKADRKKNIIIHGIPEKENETFKDRDKIIHELAYQLKMNGIDYDECKRVGRSQTRPLWVKLVRTTDKFEIMAARFNLKGSKIVIYDDLSPDERKIQGLLKAKMRELKDGNKDLKCRVTYDRLLIFDGKNSTTFAVDPATSTVREITSKQN